MNDKLNELKEKQQQISDKINLLQVTNKKKDEDTAEIQKLISECRESLKRIKGSTSGDEGAVAPCVQAEPAEVPCSEWETFQSPCSQVKEAEAPCSEWETFQTPCSQKVGESSKGRCSGARGTIGSTESKRWGTKPYNDKKRCSEHSAKKEPCKPQAVEQKKKKGKDKERVSCRVDLNKMKVRVRGPSEDLKKLDATQLINLLETYQCQELIIHTGEEIIRDPGEIRLVYCLHPGNIVMAAGIVMIAFLINANMCSEKRSCKTQFLLNVLYLSSIAFHYGMVLWMSFVRGYALKFGLSHDNFNLVDNLILPKYFSVCVLLSALSLYSFLATHCAAPCTSWPLEVVAQMIVIVVTFFMELISICYVVPAVIKLRDATDDYMLDEESCAPESYEKNLTKLGKLKWTLCLINLLTLAFLGANIYHITSKLNIGDN